MGQTSVALEGAQRGVRLGEERDVLEEAECGAGQCLRCGRTHVPRRLADDRDAWVRFVDVGNDASDDGPCGRCRGTGCCRCFNGCHAAVFLGVCVGDTVASEENEGKKGEKKESTHKKDTRSRKHTHKDGKGNEEN